MPTKVSQRQDRLLARGDYMGEFRVSLSTLFMHPTYTLRARVIMRGLERLARITRRFYQKLLRLDTYLQARFDLEHPVPLLAT